MMEIEYLLTNNIHYILVWSVNTKRLRVKYLN